MDGDDDVTYMGESGDIGDSLCGPSERKLMYLSEKDAKLIGKLSIFHYVNIIYS